MTRIRVRRANANLRERYLVGLAAVAGLTALVGCSPLSPGIKQFTTPFVPPTPQARHAEPPVVTPNPDIPQDLFAREAPTLTPSTQTTLRLTEIENRLKRAE